MKLLSGLLTVFIFAPSCFGSGSRTSKDFQKTVAEIRNKTPQEVLLAIRSEGALDGLKGKKGMRGGGEERKQEEILRELERDAELLQKLEQNPDSRDSRGLLKKAAFLAGLKLGGFVQSSGTLAASNSIRVFGKVLNSALSVSYGSTDQLSPVPAVELHTAPPDTILLIQDPNGSDTVEVGQTAKLSSDDSTTDPLTSIRNSFIKSHNSHVQRLNQRFFKDRVTGRGSP